MPGAASASSMPSGCSGRPGWRRRCWTPDTERAAGRDLSATRGTSDVGFFPATNRIYWTGDAGIAASLEDMLAWERHIDATRDDADGLYRRLSAPPRFADGTPARYGYGLVHETVAGLEATGPWRRAARVPAAAARRAGAAALGGGPVQP